MAENHYAGSSKTIARIVGILFLVATASYILADGLINSVLDAPDYLHQVSVNTTRLEAGVLLKFVTAAANIGIGVLLFPVLKAYSERIALGYLVTRIFDCAGIVVSGIGVLSLLVLSQDALQAGTESASYALANLIVAGSDTTYIVTMMALGLGAMPFCYLLYRARLVPRAIAALGFIGYLALFAGSLLEIVGVDLSMMHYVPGGLFELILPIYLIVKGFNSAATVSESAEPELKGERVRVSAA